jgi:golgin subfamily B member 1
VLEATCQNQNSAIQLLEEQKIDMTDDLNSVKHELEIVKENSEAEKKVRELEQLMADLEKTLQDVTEEQDSIGEKLTLYINENIELHEKIDKLSKGSSAESIEMVNITAQENEEYQKALGAQKDLGDDAGPEISQELNESLKSLREESSELMSKIELFTIERREVLDKLDAVTIENQVLVSSIESLREEKVALEHESDSLKKNVDRVEKLLSELQTEKQELSSKVSELNEHRSKLQEEINKLVKQGLEASPQDSPAKTAGAAGSSKETRSSVDKEACEKLLKQLDNEIQNLNKNKDKQKKLQISKKLSDNAKSVHAMMTNLLVDYFKTLDECKELREDLERVKFMMGSAPAAEKDEEEVKKIQQKLIEAEALLCKKNDEFDELQVSLFLDPLIKPAINLIPLWHRLSLKTLNTSRKNLPTMISTTLNLKCHH